MTQDTTIAAMPLQKPPTQSLSHFLLAVLNNYYRPTGSWGILWRPRLQLKKNILEKAASQLGLQHKRLVAREDWQLEHALWVAYYFLCLALEAGLGGRRLETESHRGTRAQIHSGAAGHQHNNIEGSQLGLLGCWFHGGSQLGLMCCSMHRLWPQGSCSLACCMAP